MSPTVRSRLAASATAFLLGFVLANYGILRVVGPDRALWLALAVVLMLTGAVGVIISRSMVRNCPSAVFSRRPSAYFGAVRVPVFSK